MLNHLLHATTMNRDGDPASLDGSVDFGAFDAGADADAAGSDGSEPAGTAAADGGRVGENAATDGVTDGDR